MRPGQSVVLPMMQQVGQFAYVECDDVQALRLPVTGDDMELCLVLPHETASMSALLERLTSTTWDGWIARQVIRRGTLMLPRFGVDYSAEPSLIPYLSALGLRRPFDPQQADFAGLCTAHLPDDAPIFINRIIHNTHFAVDEDGVVAAAATAVEVREIGRRYAPSQKEFTMIVNRPFLCALRQAASGVLLLLGIIDHPA